MQPQPTNSWSSTPRMISKGKSWRTKRQSWDSWASKEQAVMTAEKAALKIVRRVSNWLGFPTCKILYPRSRIRRKRISVSPKTICLSILRHRFWSKLRCSLHNSIFLSLIFSSDLIRLNSSMDLREWKMMSHKSTEVDLRATESCKILQVSMYRDFLTSSSRSVLQNVPNSK